jgi:hypothetical protein
MLAALIALNAPITLKVAWPVFSVERIHRVIPWLVTVICVSR